MSATHNWHEERALKLGYEAQKEISYNHYLPYKEDIDEESLVYLAKIKANIARTIVLNDKDGFYWINELSRYMRLYGYSFSKEDHIYFVKTIYEILFIPGLELRLVSSYANVFSALLKKRELLSPDDLVLPWRPLYQLYEKILHSQYEYLGMLFVPENFQGSLKNAVRAARPYFAKEATQEMLEEWRPLICPYDNVMIKVMAYLELFLPTTLTPDKHEFGFKLWFEEFMQLWLSCQNSPTWEQHIIWLFARLANDNIGYINWDPYMPIIFTHLMRSFNLSGGSKNVQVTRSYQVFEINCVVVWLVAMLGGQSSCQYHLTQLFTAVESYYHPSNTGKWNLKLQSLLHKLAQQFVNRLHRERFKKPFWKQQVPESHKLSEQDITDFVTAMKNCTLLGMFSRFGSYDSSNALQHLSSLRPEIVIPPVLDRLYSALDSLTEPHRLTASMSCVVAVARPLCKGGEQFPEGPLHVIPLLMNSLNGLDVNDMKKCMVTFQFISTFVTIIPIIDCSSAVDIRDDLNENEVLQCLATAQFEDFVLSFMDRCFALIENSSSEQVNRLDQENERMNAEEGIIEIGLASTFGSILLQLSPKIFQSALNKLYSFVTNHIFETKIAGRFAGILVRSCSKADPELSLQKFLPHFCKLILALTVSDDILQDEILDDELLFSMLLVQEVVRCDGKCLLKYKDMIMQVLSRTLRLTSRKGYTLASTILKNVLKSLTYTQVLDFKSISKPWSDYGNFEKDLPIKDWGVACELQELNAKWHIPDQDELNFAQELLDQFLGSQLQTLNSWVKAKPDAAITLSRDDLQKTLNIIMDCIVGAASALPLWDGENIVLHETLVPVDYTRVKSCGLQSISFSDNSNIRMKVYQTLRQVLEHIQIKCEDDTKSMCSLLRTYHSLLFYFGISKQEFDARWKGFHVVKKVLENKLSRKKENIRALVVDRLMLQHELRIVNKGGNSFTAVHMEMLKDLMKLATSHYHGVRMRSQEVLSSLFRPYLKTYRLVMPDILKNLNKEGEVTHEQFKGTLFLLLGRKGRPFLAPSDWSTLVDLWPALVNARYSEKPSIIKLIDQDITLNVKKYYDSLTLSLEIPDSCVQAAIKVWTENKSLPAPASEYPSESLLKKAKEAAIERNDDFVKSYHTLVEKLVDLLQHGNLHWRYYQLGFHFLNMLVRHDIPLPSSGVNVFVKNLNHETLAIRKIAISGVCAVLKQLKPNHPKIESKDHPHDNEWLQFSSDFKWDDESVWNKTHFCDKPHVGFYAFPKPLMVYSKEQPVLERTLDQLSDSEKLIHQCFTNEDFVNKLMEFLSLEENKDKDRFSAKKFQLWKGLFRNFGITFLPNLKGKIFAFVDSKQESQVRCCAEMIAGMVRGSKHWSHRNLLGLHELLEPILKKVFCNLTTENLMDWGTCVATMFENTDSRRLVWILNIFLDDPLKDGGDGTLSAFTQASRMYLLLGAINQQEWKGQKTFQQILSYLEENHLTHSYQNVRERIASVLGNLFSYDVQIPCLPNTFKYAPKRSNFIEKVLPKLEPLYHPQEEVKSNNSVNVSNGLTPQAQKRKDAVNLIKTLSKWSAAIIPRVPYSAPPEIFKLLPLFCLMQSETTDEQVLRETLVAIIMLSHALLTPQAVDAAIKISKEVSVATNWHARSAITTFLQYMVSSNLFILISNPEWVKEITKLILHLLDDERVEVREASAETLSGLIHCEFVSNGDLLELVKTFKKKANQKLNTREQVNGVIIKEPIDVNTRHSGILGLCACVNASPYDVSSFMPDIIMFMSDHLNDPQPIPSTIKKTLSNFKRTHHDSWRDHKLKFTEDQLAVITDLLVSPSYYA